MTFTIIDTTAATDVIKPKDVINNKKHVLLCGTHINQYNGYSKVVYELAKRMATMEDIKLTLFGFQNFSTGKTHRQLDNVEIIDALQMEASRGIKKQGFGEDIIASLIKERDFDIVVIYNDMSITSMLCDAIVKDWDEEDKKIAAGQPNTKLKRVKLVSYIDQVYMHQKPRFIQILKDRFKGIIAFTDYWKEVLVEQLKYTPDETLIKNMAVVTHGFETSMHFPIAKRVARHYFGIPQEAFVVLNLNRNQPRKRWDVCMVAFAEVVKLHQDYIQSSKEAKDDKEIKDIRFVIGTTMNGCWDLWEIFEREVRKRNINTDVAKAYLIGLAQPQGLTDRDINIIYNGADIGINTCDGEGLGLCQLEQMGIGVPQVVPNIGGFKDFCRPDNSLQVEPKWSYYVDSSRDAIGGETQVSDPMDFAKAIFEYYMNPELVKTHGENGRKHVIQNHQWDRLADTFADFMREI